MNAKKVLAVQKPPREHWIGDGFAVQSLYSQLNFTSEISPFLMLDYAAPRHFRRTDQPRGVGAHPHRGFETVTIVYRGAVEHRDSSGGGGLIQAGDVQWMTAGSGLLHDEFHAKEFSASGGEMEMVQLWVNLPAKYKMTAPRYQAITSADIPEIALADEAGQLRLIAGRFAGGEGPANTFTPINVWDLRLKTGATVDLEVSEGHSATLVVLGGKVSIRGREGGLASAHLILFDQQGTGIEIKALEEATVLLLSGEPIDEPIAAYGPFVMNTQAQIAQAIADFNQGVFGQLPAA